MFTKLPDLVAKRLHPVQLLLLLTAMFLTGWFGGFLLNGGGKWLVDAFRLAYLNQYSVRAGLADGDASYYVTSSDAQALLSSLQDRAGITAIETTFIENLLIIVISGDHPEIVQELRQNPLVSVVTTIPLFCH